MPNRKIVCLCLTAWLSATAYLSATTTDSETSVLRSLAARDNRFQAAFGAREQGDIAGAYSTLADLLREYPADEDVNFAFGLLAIERGRPSLGILAFERVLSMHPTNHRARLELARAYYLIGQWEQARQQFNQVLDHDPPQTVRDTIYAYLRDIKRNKPGWRFHRHIETGVLYDSNVNSGPRSLTVGIAPLTIGGIRYDELRVDPVSAPQSAWGGFGAFTLRARYDATRREGLSFDGQVRGYANCLIDASDFNISGLRAGGGPRFDRNRHTVHVPLNIEHIQQGESSLATLTGLYPTHHFRYTPEWSLFGKATIEHRNFAGRSERDGFLAAFDEQLIRHFGFRSRHRAAIGFRLGREFADADIYSNTEIETALRLALWQSPRLHFFADATARYREYDERELLAPATRRDVQWGVTTGIAHFFTPRWGTDIVIQYTENDSSFDLYDFTRYTATWSIGYEF